MLQGSSAAASGAGVSRSGARAGTLTGGSLGVSATKRKSPAEGGTGFISVGRLGGGDRRRRGV